MFKRGQKQIIDVNRLIDQTKDYGELQGIQKRISTIITQSIEKVIHSDEETMRNGGKLYAYSSCLHPFDGSVDMQRLADAIGYEMPEKTLERLHECVTKVTAYLDEQERKEAEKKEAKKEEEA